MIVVTGAAGFIGSNLSRMLHENGYLDLVLVDDFSDNKKHDLKELNAQKIHRDEFFSWLKAHHRFVQFIFHLGARTDTAEFDYSVLKRLNLEYSKQLFELCTSFAVPIIYASSAATYGDGSLGYKDDHSLSELLQPLNPYGVSKNEFDRWILTQDKKPFFWAGLKFFNVYGPGEEHKSRMASVVYHGYHQIKKTGQLNLFRSHKENYLDGEQKRDFIYVKDLCQVCMFLMHLRKHSDIYNLGSGQARTFNDLAYSIFAALNVKQYINYIDIPKDIRDKYQYFTQADMHKLKSVGYTKPFTSIEKGVKLYVDYLEQKTHA